MAFDLLSKEEQAKLLAVLDYQPAIDRDIEAKILVQTSDNKGIPMVRPVRDSKPMGAPLERMGPEPDKKQMACMAGG